ncbi:DNA methyltransferase [Ruficoccus amylovorans]|uniref:DNA methyltransferase n=1 Tax=Ruficoccus amylovorans TaxID=1804625 RepID=UPI0031B5B4EA
MEACCPAFAANKVICGDCIDVMRTLPDESMDFVITDPPYLVNYHSRDKRSFANDTNADWVEPAFEEIYRVLKNNSYCVCFYGWSAVEHFISAWEKAGFRRVGHFTACKRYSSSQRHTAMYHECAFLLAKGRPKLPEQPLCDLLPWRYTGNRLHPTQKPVETFQPLIQTYAPPGGMVLDPFAGSGTAGEAAILSGREYLLIELDPQYTKAARERLERRWAL